MNTGCIFCKIINKEIESEIIYEDENVIAFKDIYPKAKFHILVVPKKHIEKHSDVEDYNIFSAMHIAANKIVKKYNINGYKLLINNGKLGGQIIFHLHMHILSGEKIDLSNC